MSIPDGGPAFPSDNYRSDERGMSLRDWFAGMALQGRLSNDTLLSNAEQSGLPSDKFPETMARQAYGFADAMIAERNKP